MTPAVSWIPRRELHCPILLLNHAHINVVKPTSSVLFLVAENLMLRMLEANATVVIFVVLVARLAPIIAGVHRHVLAPLLQVLCV